MISQDATGTNPPGFIVVRYYGYLMVKMRLWLDYGYINIHLMEYVILLLYRITFIAGI